MEQSATVITRVWVTTFCDYALNIQKITQLLQFFFLGSGLTLDVCRLLCSLVISFTLSNSASGEQKDSHPFLKVRTGDGSPVPQQ